jgi:hypothetical protein
LNGDLTRHRPSRGGNTKTEAIRALRRRISDEVFRLQGDETATAGLLAVAA